MNLEVLADPRQGSNAGPGYTISRQPGARGSQIILWTLGCALGLAYAFAVVGPRVLNPLDVSWLISDPATGYLGWGFFRQEAHLTLPLGWSDSIGYPLGEPISYLDSIPLLATIFWLFRGILPDNFQYLGIYFVICCILQFCFGFRISCRLCRGDRVAGILGGVFFLTAPAFTWRALGHFALISHWTILAALDQFLGATVRPTRGQIAWRCVLCFVAGGINPYIAAMTVLVLFGTFLRLVIDQRNGLVRSCLGLGVALCSALGSLALFGFIRAADASQYAGDGYEKYSMNLLAPIDPERYGALLLRPQAIGVGQSEGYNYLGLGLLLLGVISISRRPSSMRYLLSIQAVPALVIFIPSLLLALSLLGKAGSFTLWHFSLPHPIMALLTSLRASGRLFWPGYYLLFIAIIALSSRAFFGRWFYAALGVALVVQFLDLAPLRGFISRQWHFAVAPTVSPNPAWHDLGQIQKHLVVVPPWQCSASPGGAFGYAIFGRLAVEQHMTINSFYAGRYSDAQMAFFCGGQMAQIEHDGLRRDTAYVFAKNNAVVAIGLRYGGQYCRQVDQYILCSQVPGQSGLDPAISRDVVTLRSGDIVPFSSASTASDGILGLGWSGSEPWGRWASGKGAVIAFNVPSPIRRDVRLELSIQPFVSPSHQQQRVFVTANGEALPQKIDLQSADSVIDLVIPARLIADDGLVRLAFAFPDAISPEALGQNSDDRRELSIGVKQLYMEDSGN